MLLEHGIRISRDGKGGWRDNVFIERAWRSIEYEEVYLHAYETESAAREGIGRYLNFYNTPHSSHQARTSDVVVVRIGASAFGQRSLTPQGPLINLTNLFR